MPQNDATREAAKNFCLQRYPTALTATVPQQQKAGAPAAPPRRQAPIPGGRAKERGMAGKSKEEDGGNEDSGSTGPLVTDEDGDDQAQQPKNEQKRSSKPTNENKAGKKDS